MGEENISQELRLENIEETINYFIKEIEQNELISKKHKKTCATLSYLENLLVLASVVTRCLLMSAFASLLGIPMGITSSTIRLKIFTIATGIKKCKSITKKKKKKHDKIVPLAKNKLNSIEVLISKDLTDSYFSHNEFVLVYNVLNEYNDIKKEINNLKTSTLLQRFEAIYKTCYLIALSADKIQKVKTLGL